jgi:hypothetical protein
MEPTRPGPGNPAMSSGLLSLIGPSFAAIVEFISVDCRILFDDLTNAIFTFLFLLLLSFLFILNNILLSIKTDNSFYLLT